VIASVWQHLGPQQLLIASIASFAFGTAFCALAHDVAVMLVGHCVQGLGGGGVVAITQVVFSDLVPLRERPKYFSVVLGSWATGSIVGPMVGGALVERASWRWCFHVNFPFCAISFVAACVFIRPGRASTAPLAQKLGQVDWAGAVLFVASLTSFLVGLSWGGVQHPWTSPATKAPIAAGMVGVALFLGWQVYRGENSLLPLTLFRSVSSVAAFYGALVNGLVVSFAPAITGDMATD
jgi:MFS family permease